MVIRNMRKISREQGFTFPELMISLLLTMLLIAVLAGLTVSFGGWWGKNNGLINIEQNMWSVAACMTNELQRAVGTIVFPPEGGEADYLEVRNAGNYKTIKFYVANSQAYPTIPTLYRYAKDDREYTGGAVQLTEPSKVAVSNLTFKQVSGDTITIILKIKDLHTGFERELYTTVHCCNAGGH